MLNLALRPGQTAVFEEDGRAPIRLYARLRSGTRLHFAVDAPESVKIRREDGGPVERATPEDIERRSLSARLAGVADRLEELSPRTSREKGILNDINRAIAAVRRDLVAPAPAGPKEAA